MAITVTCGSYLLADPRCSRARVPIEGAGERGDIRCAADHAHPTQRWRFVAGHMLEPDELGPGSRCRCPPEQCLSACGRRRRCGDGHPPTCTTGLRADEIETFLQHPVGETDAATTEQDVPRGGSIDIGGATGKPVTVGS